MIPLRDDNPTVHRPVVSVLIILACAGVYFMIQPIGHVTPFRHAQSSSVASADERFTYAHAAVPCELTHRRPLTGADLQVGCAAVADRPIFPHKNVWLSVLWSMFLHGSLLHIGGNMLFLWIFGNNVEDRLGPVRYLAFYLASGIAATVTFVILQPGSVIPLIGASGAIAGVMGAYLVMFPRVRIHSLILVPPIVLYRAIPAAWLLLFWFASQFLVSPSSGVAWTAHVGGFVFGTVVGLFYRARSRPVPTWN